MITRTYSGRATVVNAKGMLRRKAVGTEVDFTLRVTGSSSSFSGDPVGKFFQLSGNIDDVRGPGVRYADYLKGEEPHYNWVCQGLDVDIVKVTSEYSFKIRGTINPNWESVSYFDVEGSPAGLRRMLLRDVVVKTTVTCVGAQGVP